MRWFVGEFVKYWKACDSGCVRWFFGEFVNIEGRAWVRRCGCVFLTICFCVRACVCFCSLGSLRDYLLVSFFLKVLACLLSGGLSVVHSG